MITQCCVCKKVRQGHRWVAPTAQLPEDETISHGYCPSCAKEAFREVEAHFATLRPATATG